MRRSRNIAPWLWGLLIATLLFGTLLLFASYQYIGSDDAPILRSFMGYDGGVPATFNLYLHTAFAWLLYALAMLASGVAWFSILQLFLLWFSQVVIVKSLVQLARRRGWPLWTGALAGAALLAALTVYITCHISYTTTSALCGAAAVAQLTSVDFTAPRRRSVIGPILGSAGLLLCSYCLRQISVLPPLCFWLLVLAVKLLTAFGRKKLSWKLAKPVFAGVLATGLLFGLFAGVRALDIRLNNAEDFLHWQTARIRLYDYTHFGDTTTDETLQKVGWSRNEFTLATYWYFMDDNITAEAFDTLMAQQIADESHLTLSDRLSAAWSVIDNCMSENTAMRYGMYAALAMGLAATFLLLRRRAAVWELLGVLLAVLGGGLLIGYLAYTGRLPMRAAMSVLLPAAATLYASFFGLAPAPQPQPALDTPPAAPVKTAAGDATALLLWVLTAASLAVCLWLTVTAVRITAPTIRPLTDEESNYSTVNTTDLDQYALENPDKLFFCDLSLANDYRLFPDTSKGIPNNVMYWGGYPARSPSWYRMLHNFGITELNASIFLRDDVLIASTDAEPWQCFMGYMQEQAGDNVDWDFYDTYGYLFFFQIYQT
jgi:hypothetical protein